MEFKLKNKEAVTDASIAVRKAVAQNIFKEVSASPELMQKLTNGRASENVFYNVFSGTINQLPDIYKANESVLNSLEK